MNIRKSMTVLMLLAGCTSTVYAMDPDPSIGSSSFSSGNQISQDLYAQLTKAQTLDEAIGFVVQAYPKYDIEEFFDAVSDKELGIFRELAQKEENKEAAQERVMSLFYKNLSPLSFHGGGTYEKQYEEFIKAIFDSDHQYMTPSDFTHQEDQKQVDKISALFDALASGEITDVEYVEKLTGLVHILFNKLGYDKAYNYIKKALIHLSDHGTMTVELAQAAEKLYYAVLEMGQFRLRSLVQPTKSDFKENIDVQQLELWNIVLNSFYMKIDSLPKNERMVLAMDLILSNPGFAHDYLTKIFRYDCKFAEGSGSPSSGSGSPPFDEKK